MKPLILFLAALLPAAAQVEPSGGLCADPLQVGHTVRIEWSDDLQTPMVDLAVWNADLQTEQAIAEAIPASDHAYEWQIPVTLPPSDRYRFVVRDHAQPRRALRSRSWVHIIPAQPMVATVHHDQETPALTIQPAPATNDVTLTWQATTVVLVEMYDTKQHRLGSWSVSPGQTRLHIDLSELPSGNHHVRLLSPTAVIATQMLPIVR